MVFENYIENMIIYVENVSYFYVVCAAISFLAVGFSWWIQPQFSCTEILLENKLDTSGIPTVSPPGRTSGNCDSLRSNLFDKKLLIKSVERTLTNDDRLKECEVEKQQLKEIFELMKKDEKFNITSMEELEEQLKLYRK